MIADASAAAPLRTLAFGAPRARGVLYANAGLLDDAEREFTDDRRRRAAVRIRVDAFLAQLRQARAPR